MNQQNPQSIALIVYQSELGKVLVDIEVEVAGTPSRFLFDTGAATTQIKLDDATRGFKKLGNQGSKGASGNEQMQDLVEVPELAFGMQKHKNLRVSLGDRSILGLDLLANKKFIIDLPNQSLDFVKELQSTEKVHRLDHGHLTIPVQISDLKSRCLFDTGADTTVIDESFVKKHSHHFTLTGSEQGEDAHGNKFASNLYQCHQFRIGHLEFESIDMAAFEFGEHLRTAMEGVPIILGTNVIKKAKWGFDFENGNWTSQP